MLRAGSSMNWPVPRFRSSSSIAATSNTNFGSKGPKHLYDSSAAFEFEVPSEATCAAPLIRSCCVISGLDVILTSERMQSRACVPTVMPQSLLTCRDPAFSLASIQQIRLRDGVTEYQHGHRAGLRITIRRMHAGNMKPN